MLQMLQNGVRLADVNPLSPQIGTVALTHDQMRPDKTATWSTQPGVREIRDKYVTLSFNLFIRDLGHESSTFFMSASTILLNP